MEERHVPLSTVAGRLGVSERTVRRWIKSGKLKAIRPGRDYRISEDAVRQLMEESEVYPKVQAPLWPEAEPEPERRESRDWGQMVRETLGVDVGEISVAGSTSGSSASEDVRAEWDLLTEALEELVAENERLRATVAELREELAKAKETV
jgi:excisionase family DNA binding protein